MNLIAQISEATDSADQTHLYLVAHYDSKSQRLPLALRVALFVVALAGSGAFASLIWLGIFVPGAALAATPWAFS